MTKSDCSGYSMRLALVGLALGSIFLLDPVSQSAAQVSVQEVRVYGDSKQAVTSHIRLMNAEEKETAVDDTDDDGVLREKFVCPAHNRVVAQPISGTYRKSPPQRCADKIEIHVWSPATTQVLFANAQHEAAKGRDSVAALLYNETFQRAQGDDSATAEAARTQAIVYAAKALKIAPATSTDQGKIVPSDKLVAALTDYQKANGLPVTGKIDSATLNSLARTSAGPFIAKALQ
jgi:hypothetical protein